MIEHLTCLSIQLGSTPQTLDRRQLQLPVDPWWRGGAVEVVQLLIERVDSVAWWSVAERGGETRLMIEVRLMIVVRIKVRIEVRVRRRWRWRPVLPWR